jgi:hypothetical protein
MNYQVLRYRMVRGRFAEDLHHIRELRDQLDQLIDVPQVFRGLDAVIAGRSLHLPQIIEELKKAPERFGFVDEQPEIAAKWQSLMKYIDRYLLARSLIEQVRFEAEHTRSRYEPHQGKRELARRQRRLAA